MTVKAPGSILLVSCYELGHQPMGVAMPMGFLEAAGFQPSAIDIAVEEFDEERAKQAKLVGISVPMHTALRLGVRVAERIREVNPDCCICFYGLYASLNADYLLDHNGDACIGGEYESPLVRLAEAIDSGHEGSVEGVIQRVHPAKPVLEKLSFPVPSRTSLPILDQYAHLEHEGQCRTSGHVEATRGCLHLCTHCPIPPVYGGRFFAVPRDVVLQDIRHQVEAGATHITFGDPDFLNGPKHSLRIVQEMHKEFPSLTFDFTAKVEHLLNRGQDLEEFAKSGCLFVISAVESLSDRVLTILDKRHTPQDVVDALEICRNAGITMRPTWVMFTPWTTKEDIREVLDFVETNQIIDHIDPVQYSIRLLIPPGSWLAEHEETLPYRGDLDEASFTYRWEHPDPTMDQLQKDIARIVEEDARDEADSISTFYRIRELVVGESAAPSSCSMQQERGRAPRMTESWFC